MAYSVYVQKFIDGEPAFAPAGEVMSILERYGRVAVHNGRAEFLPEGPDICEVGYLEVDELGIDGISFERPVSGSRLQHLVFELLGVEGMCFFELDARYVLARSDVTALLPEGLVSLCESGKCTVVSRAEEVPL